MPTVKIKVEASGDASGSQTANEALQSVTSDEELKKRTAAATLFEHAMIGKAKQILNYSVSNISSFTGDYIKQERVQQGMEYLQDAATLVLGFSRGLVTGTIAVIGLAVDKGLEITQFIQDQRKSTIDFEYMQDRSGNSTLDGGRGTEN